MKHEITKTELLHHIDVKVEYNFGDMKNLLFNNNKN